MPHWEEIRNEWETTKITLKELAEKHDIKLGTLKSRKSREKWSRDATQEDATKPQKVATKTKKDATDKKQIIPESLPSDELTDKQRLFCMYYLKYFNATKAYQKAYDCTYLTARVEGSRNLTKPSIKKEIDRMKAEQAQGFMLDATHVLQKYIDIAFTDITDYMKFGKRDVVVDYDKEGNPITREFNFVDFNESTEIDGTLISEVKQGKDGVSIKLADKMKALEMLAKYFDVLPQSYKEQLQSEKAKVEIEFIEERTKLIKGDKKDTSLLDELIKTVKGDD